MLTTIPGHQAILAVWSAVAGVELSPALFFGFMGTCKVAGVLAMWGAFGPQLDQVANLCFVPQLLGAAYTHHAMDDTVVPPLVFLAAVVARLATPAADTAGKDGKTA